MRFSSFCTGAGRLSPLRPLLPAVLEMCSLQGPDRFIDLHATVGLRGGVLGWFCKPALIQ